MKNIGVLSLTLIISLTLIPAVYAEDMVSSDSEVNPVKTKELKVNQKAEMRVVKDEMKDQKMLLRNTRKASDSAGKKNKAMLKESIITAINGSTLTVTKSSKSYTVTTTTSTKLKRHYGADSVLSEFAVGNKIDVVGEWSDASMTTITAKHIRNRSIMKRHGVFMGTVVSLNGNTLILASNNRGNQTVTLSPSTKFVNRKQVAIVQTDILTGHKIRIKGMWDKSNNTVTQVTNVKDFTLPSIKPSVAASPTASASVTPVATDSATTQ